MDGVEGFGAGMLCNRNMKTPYPCYILLYHVISCYIMDLSYKISSCFRKKYEGTTYNYHAIHYISDNNDKKTSAWKWYDRFFFGKKRKLSLTGSPSRSGFGAWHLTHAPPDSRVCLRMRDQSISCHVPRVKKIQFAIENGQLIVDLPTKNCDFP